MQQATKKIWSWELSYSNVSTATARESYNNVRRKFTCFVTYRYIDRVVSYLFSTKFQVRCQLDSNKKTALPLKKYTVVSYKQQFDINRKM